MGTLGRFELILFVLSNLIPIILMLYHRTRYFQSGVYKTDHDRLAMKILLLDNGNISVTYGGEKVISFVYYGSKNNLRAFELKLGNGTVASFELFDYRTIIEHIKSPSAKIRKWIYCNHKTIESSVIGHGSSLKDAGSRLKQIFHGKINITQWATYFLEECPTFDLKPVIDAWHSGAKLVGVATYHKMVWEEFVRRRDDLHRKEKISGTSSDPYMIIFEHDAVCGVSNCGDMALQQVQETTADILYLGWCHQANEATCPVCSHAYALSIRGARVLLQRVYNCGGFVDMQMRHVADDGHLTWALATLPSNTKQATSTKGLFLQNW